MKVSNFNTRHGRRPEPRNLNMLRRNVEKFVEHETFSQISKLLDPLVDGWRDFCIKIWVRCSALSSDDFTTMIRNVARVVVEIINQ